MVESEEDSKKENSEEFDYRAELSILVANNVLPAKIAERLEKRLTEKNVKINKEQLHTIANKINEILKNYKPGSKLPEPSKGDSEIKEKSEINPESSSNMNELLENIGKLQSRIENIEKDLSEFINPIPDETQTAEKQEEEIEKTEKTPTIVTTEDIKIPESYKNYENKLEIDPLNKIPSDPESIVVLMKWLQYLIDKSGRMHLPEVLDYYVDIGWISEEAKIVLMDYSNGITFQFPGIPGFGNMIFLFRLRVVITVIIQEGIEIIEFVEKVSIVFVIIENLSVNVYLIITN